MIRLALGLGKFVQTRRRAVAALRDAYLNAMDVTGAAEWLQSRIKPIPAYGEGTFAERPHPFPPKRSVGSQFPQPSVVTDGEGFSTIGSAGGGARSHPIPPRPQRSAPRACRSSRSGPTCVIPAARSRLGSGASVSTG